MIHQCQSDDNNANCLLRQLAEGTVNADDRTLTCRHCECTIAEAEQQASALGRQEVEATADYHAGDSARGGDGRAFGEVAATADFDPSAGNARPSREIKRETSIHPAEETLAFEATVRSEPLEFPSIEGYEVTGQLGAGGMGTVWRAVQLSTKRSVALKTTNVAAFGSEDGRIRFQREVELSARLEHPNIASVYASGQDGNVCFYALELIDGDRLDDYVRREKLNDQQVLQLLGKICRAVQHAHQRGVIHRDLKPSNILVDSAGEPHVLDFGLAKSMIEEDREDLLMLTREGAIAGTPAFMAPEQAAGRVREIDTRTDVYTLGVILYRLLTGEPPHDLSGSHFEVFRRIAEEDVRRPRQMRPRLDAEVEAILLKALAKAPAERYATAGDLGDDLDRYLQGDPIEAHAPSTLYFLRKRVKKNRGKLSLAIAVLAAVVVGVGFYIHSVELEHDKTQREFERAESNATLLAAKVVEADENAQQARLHATRAECNAEDAKQKQAEAERQEAAAKAARELEARQTYWTTIKLVAERLGNGQIGGVARTLWDTKKELRGWEWGYLMSQVPIERWTIPAHDGAILDMVVSEDKKLLATCGGDGRCALWNLENKPNVWKHQSDWPLKKVAFDPAGRFVAVTDDHGVTVLAADSGEKIKRIDDAPCSHVVFVASGVYLCVFRDLGVNKQVINFRTSDWQEHCSAKVFGADTFAFDRGGKFIAISGGSKPRMARLFQPDSLQEIRSFQVTASSPWTGIMEVDSQNNLLVASDFQTVRFFALDQPDLKTAKVLNTELSSGGVYSLAVDLDEEILATANNNGDLEFYDLTGKLTGVASHGAGISRVRSLGGGLFVSAGRGGQIKCWDGNDLTNLPKTEEVAMGDLGFATHTAISSDNRVVAAGGAWFGVGDTKTGNKSIADLRDLRIKIDHAGLCGADDLLAVGIDRTVAFYDLKRPPREPVKTVSCRDMIKQVAVNRAGTTTVVAYKGGGVEVFDIATGDPRPILRQISHECIPLVSAGGDVAAALIPETQELIVWKADSGKIVQSIQGKLGRWQCGGFHPEGNVIAAADRHGGIFIWNIEAGELLAEMLDHVGVVNSLAFSPDGSRLFSASEDRSLRVWDWTLGRQLLQLDDKTVAYGVSLDSTGHILCGTSGAPYARLRRALPWTYDEDDAQFYRAVDKYRDQATERRTVSGSGVLSVLKVRYPEWTEAHIASCETRLTRLRKPSGLESAATRNQQRQLARRLAEMGRFAEAYPLFEELVQYSREHLEKTHPEAFSARVDLACLHLVTGRIKDAATLLEEIAGAVPQNLPTVRPFTICMPKDYSLAEDQLEPLKEVIRILTEQSELMKRELEPNDAWTLTLANSLGVAHLLSGDPASAAPRFREVEGPMKKTFGWTHPSTLAPRHNLILAFQAMPRHDKQLVSTCEQLYSLRRSVGPRDVDLFAAATDLAEAYFVTSKYDQAASTIQDAIAQGTQIQGRDSLLSYNRILQGGCLLAQKKLVEAESALSIGYDGVANSSPPASNNLKARAVLSLHRIAGLYDEAGQVDQAQRWRDKLTLLQPQSEP